jgi:threonine dehydratase
VTRTGAVHRHAYDQPEIAAGAGTLALELLEQAPSPLTPSWSPSAVEV